MERSKLMPALRMFCLIFLIILSVACAPKYTLELPVNYVAGTISCIKNSDPDTSGKCGENNPKSMSETRHWSQIAATARKMSSNMASLKSINQSMDQRKARLKIVTDIFTDETHSILMEQLLQPATNSQVELSTKQLNAYFTKVWGAAQVNALQEYYDDIKSIDIKTLGLVSQEEVNVAILKDIGIFLKKYLEAYFRSGQFIKVELNADDAKKKIKEQLADAIPNIQNSDIDALFTQLEKLLKQENGKYSLYTRTSDGAFRSRGGADYGFPTVTLTVTPFGQKPVDLSKIDFPSIGSDVLRVFIEANGDALLRLPADPTSTACKAKDNAGNPAPLLTAFVSNDKAVPEHSSTSITSAQFNKVNAIANSIDAAVGTATSQVIRGLGWTALNNEALAKLIETILSTSARKIAEKTAWCAFSCYNYKNKDSENNDSKSIQAEQVTFDSLSKTTILIK